MDFRYWMYFQNRSGSPAVGGPCRSPSIRRNPRANCSTAVNSDIAWVDWEGRVQLGWSVGATVIMVYDSPSRDSVRYIQVEVIEENGGGYGIPS